MKKFKKDFGISAKNYAIKLVLEDTPEDKLSEISEKIQTEYGTETVQDFLKGKEITKEKSFRKKYHLYKKRKELEKTLNEIPEGERIKLNKDLLESLIFEERNIVYDDDYQVRYEKVKYPVWTGKFLRKVDLSEVSFDNVDWTCYGLSAIDKKIYNYDIQNNKPDTSPYLVDLSYTNAKIDFSKASQTIATPENQKTNIAYCNLSHVDLSDSNCSHIYSIINSDLSNSNLKIDEKFSLKENTQSTYDFIETYILNYDRKIVNSNLEGNDFSNIKMSAIDIYENARTTNFANTGLNIVVETKSEQAYWNFIYSEIIAKGYLENCCVGDLIIDSKSDYGYRTRVKTPNN